MRAIKIDVVNQTITEVEMKGSSLNEMYRLLECEMIEAITLNRATKKKPGNILWVDEEGLLKPSIGYFELEDFPQTLSGHGLVTGIDYDGETVATTLSVEEISSKIEWVIAIR